MEGGVERGKGRGGYWNTAAKKMRTVERGILMMGTEKRKKIYSAQTGRGGCCALRKKKGVHRQRKF